MDPRYANLFLETLFNSLPEPSVRNNSNRGVPENGQQNQPPVQEEEELSFQDFLDIMAVEEPALAAEIERTSTIRFERCMEEYRSNMEREQLMKKVTVKKAGEECSICLDAKKVDQDIRGLSCAHEYHYQCISDWLERNSSCPSCRSDAIMGVEKKEG